MTDTEKLTADDLRIAATLCRARAPMKSGDERDAWMARSKRFEAARGGVLMTAEELATLEVIAGQFANRASVLFVYEGSEDIASRDLTALAKSLRSRRSPTGLTPEGGE